jgi:hypothetical protein
MRGVPTFDEIKYPYRFGVDDYESAFIADGRFRGVEAWKISHAPRADNLLPLARLQIENVDKTLSCVGSEEAVATKGTT